MFLKIMIIFFLFIKASANKLLVEKVFSFLATKFKLYNQHPSTSTNWVHVIGSTQIIERNKCENYCVVWTPQMPHLSYLVYFVR